MKTSRRNWVAAAVVAGLLIAGGAGRAWATDYIWDGNGDFNNGGNWSSANNWDLDSSYPQTAPDTATIPLPTSARNISVDVDAHVSKLTWPSLSGPVNTITLDANLVMDEISTAGPDGKKGQFLDLNINGHTVFVDKGANEGGTPVFRGGGLIVKQGVDTFYMGDYELGDYTHPFTGEWIVSNGTLKVASDGRFSTYWPNCTNVTVASGAGVSGTVEVNSAFGQGLPGLPLSFTIAGPGYLNQGALRWTVDLTFARPITVTNDASVYVASGKTVSLDAALLGSGTLTVIGGGELKILSGTSTHNGMIVINNGTLSVSGLLPSVTNITIEAGGTLNGSQAHYPLATVVNNGGTWNAVDTDSTWSGLGDNATWSQAANWFVAVPVGIEAFIPLPTSDRNIIVDVDAHVSKLIWPSTQSGPLNTITLDANLVMDEISTAGPDGRRKGQFLDLNINGHTVFVDKGANEGGTPLFRGGGLIVKQGVDTFYMGDYTHPFTGDWIVSNGTLKVASDARFSTYWPNCTNVTVASGAGVSGTVEFNSAQPGLPLSFTIAGPGFSSLGALRWTVGFTGASAFAKPITVQADATCYIGSGLTVEHTRVLDGNGVMTLIGGGTYDMNNVWTGTVSSATCNGIVAAAGTVDIAGCTLSLAGLETASANEYVLVDHASANGYLVGTSFAAVNGLTGRWEIDYDGTDAHPDAVVLVLPPMRGSVLIVR